MLKGCRILGFEFRSSVTRRPEAHRRNEAELTELLAARRVVPHIGSRFGLEQAAAALRWVADGKAIGKVVVEVRAPGA